MMKNIIISSVIIIFTLCITYFINGCSDDSVKPVTDTDPGILQTDEFGNVLGGDTTDWCRDSSSLYFGPSYPNPCSTTFRVRFAVPAEDTVMIYFLRSVTDTTVFYRSRVLPGYYEITINDSTRSDMGTYQRLYFKSKRFTPSSNCKFYGDIKFVQ